MFRPIERNVLLRNGKFHIILPGAGLDLVVVWGHKSIDSRKQDIRAETSILVKRPQPSTDCISALKVPNRLKPAFGEEGQRSTVTAIHQWNAEAAAKDGTRRRPAP